MIPIKLFLFDLDGTLIDSKLDIANSMNHTLSVLNLPQISNELIYSFVGNGVTPLIQQSVEATGEHSFEKAFTIFKKHYLDHCLDKTHVFDGVFEVLEYFSSVPKIIITNKSQNFSEKIVQGLKLESHFKGLYGGDTEFPKKPDPTLVKKLLHDFQASPHETVIIGDSAVDIQTGKNSGILTCGVTYGFRPKEEIEQIKPDQIIDHPRKLITLYQS